MMKLVAKLTPDGEGGKASETAALLGVGVV
jgi:hypothetical protein